MREQYKIATQLRGEDTEIKKARPALVVSPDDLNAALPRVIIAPLTSKGQPLGGRPGVKLKGKSALILLDQLCSVDKRRLAKEMGEIDLAKWHPVLLLGRYKQRGKGLD